MLHLPGADLRATPAAQQVALRFEMRRWSPKIGAASHHHSLSTSEHQVRSVANNNITLTIGGALELILKPPTPCGEVWITAKFQQFIVQGRGPTMAYTLPVDMLVVVQVGYVDAHNNPAKVDGDVVWATSDGNIVSITPDQRDSTICTLTAVGATGLAQVTATADADLGEGTREIITTLDVSVVPGEAIAGTIKVIAEPQPVAPHPEQQK
jgi:hypothetical protein